MRSRPTRLLHRTNARYLLISSLVSFCLVLVLNHRAENGNNNNSSQRFLAAPVSTTSPSVVPRTQKISTPKPSVYQTSHNHPPQTTGSALKDLQLFIIWPDAYRYKKKIINDLATQSTFRILDIVEITWESSHYQENLWRLYSGKGGEKRQGMALKERQCGKGPFTVLLVEDTAPHYQDEDTFHGMDHVNHNVNEKKKLYRSWAGGFRVHGTFNAAEAEHDLYLIYGMTLWQLQQTYNPAHGLMPKERQSTAETYGYFGFETCAALTEALRVAGGGLMLDGQCGAANFTATVKGSVGYNTLIGTAYQYTMVNSGVMAIRLRGGQIVRLNVLRKPLGA